MAKVGSDEGKGEKRKEEAREGRDRERFYKFLSMEDLSVIFGGEARWRCTKLNSFVGEEWSIIDPEFEVTEAVV